MTTEAKTRFIYIGDNLFCSLSKRGISNPEILLANTEAALCRCIKPQLLRPQSDL
jgi:hypothetical protein